MKACLTVAGIICFAFLPLHVAQSLTVDEAYRAIPHQQTTYRPDRSTLSGTQARALSELFRAVDEAIVARVETLRWFQSAGRSGQAFSVYRASTDRLVASIAGLRLEPAAARARDWVVAAIREQQRFFQKWDTKRRENSSAPFAIQSGTDADQHIRSSSGLLHKAYNDLMQAYPAESAHNRQAFFDHLCALDFV